MKSGERMRRLRDDTTAQGVSVDDVRGLVVAGNLAFGQDTQQAVARHAWNHMFGAGPLQGLLEDPLVTDILVNGHQVWVDRGQGLVDAGLSLESPRAARELAVQLATRAGARLDDAHPVVDAQLPDGSRLHAVIEPISPTPATISLRAFRARHLSLRDLVQWDMIPAQWVSVFTALVEHRVNLLISGGTGTGKTTLLSTLLGHVPHTERIITIEDSREIATTHPHVVALQSRAANAEGAGAVDLTELVRNALRMRPDRVMLGECRGAEIRDLLMAFNTGHSGGAATLHANSAHDVPARLIALGALAGMDPQTTVLQVASALDVIVHITRPLHGRRYISDISALTRSDSGHLVVQPLLTWDGVSVPRRHDVSVVPAWLA